MNERKSGLTGKGVSIRNIQIIITVITVIISILLLAATYKAASGYRVMRDETNEFIALQESAAELQEASDYLTEQVRCYAETGKLEYLNNYFNEAKATRRRDHALETIESYMSESAAAESLGAAMKESVALMEREYYSMRLTSEAYGYDLSKLPEEIQDVKLSKKDAALSDDKKEALARKMVFDDVYHGEKQLIYDNMADCLSALEKTVEKEQQATSDEFAALFKQLRLMIIIAILITLAAMAFTLLLLVSPLLRAVVFIHADEPIPVEGSKEFRFLADTYNSMYESNKEQKEQLEFEATHDHLTGLYNRSGYDYFMKNMELDDTALIILDVDKFKKVNDNNGHDVGDLILAKVARCIRESFRSQDHVCRLGGDEFAVILQHVDSVSLKAVADKVNLINDKLADTSDGLPAVHLSAGVALGLNRDRDEVFRKADASLYKVKERGGSGYDIADSTDSADSDGTRSETK